MIGRITTWGKHYGIRCALHKSCSIAVSSKSPCDHCVRWLAGGVPPPPPMCTDEVRADLKKQHFALPRPRASKPAAQP